MSEDGSSSKCFLERVESITTERVKIPQNVLSDEICQWNDNVWVVEDELVIEISETQEGLNILDFLSSS